MIPCSPEGPFGCNCSKWKINVDSVEREREREREREKGKTLLPFSPAQPFIFLFTHFLLCVVVSSPFLVIDQFFLS